MEKGGGGCMKWPGLDFQARVDSTLTKSFALLDALVCFATRL